MGIPLLGVPGISLDLSQIGSFLQVGGGERATYSENRHLQGGPRADRYKWSEIIPINGRGCFTLLTGASSPRL